MLENLCVFHTADELTKYKSKKAELYDNMFPKVERKNSHVDAERTQEIIDSIYRNDGVRYVFQRLFNRPMESIKELDRLLKFNAAVAVMTNFLFLQDQADNREVPATNEDCTNIRKATPKKGCNYQYSIAQEYINRGSVFQNKTRPFRSFLSYDLDDEKNYFSFDLAVNQLKTYTENWIYHEKERNNTAAKAKSRAIDAFDRFLSNMITNTAKEEINQGENCFLFSFFELLFHYRAFVDFKTNLIHQVPIQETIRTFVNQCDVPIVFGTEYINFNSITSFDTADLFNGYAEFVKDIGYYLYRCFDNNVEKVCEVLENYLGNDVFKNLRDGCFASLNEKEKNKFERKYFHGIATKDLIDLFSVVVSVFSADCPQYYAERFDINAVNTYTSEKYSLNRM